MKNRMRSSPTEREVMEMLGIARNYSDELNSLRRRLRDVENGMRLAESKMMYQQEGALSESGQLLTQMYAERREQINQRMQHLMKKRAQLEGLLLDLNEMERRIITLRWVDGKSWHATAMKIYLCERHGQRIQKAAIEKMARKLEKET